MDYDLVDQSPDHGFLYFWGIECLEELRLEGVDVGGALGGVACSGGSRPHDRGRQDALRKPIGEPLNLIIVHWGLGPDDHSIAAKLFHKRIESINNFFLLGLSDSIPHSRFSPIFETILQSWL